MKMNSVETKEKWKEVKTLIKKKVLIQEQIDKNLDNSTTNVTVLS